VSGRILALLLASLGQTDKKKEFYQDFRGGGAVHHALTPFGPNRDQAIRQESRGLLIALPAKRRDARAVGLAPKFRIAGDFEITIDYEILSADEPTSGNGVGVGIWAKLRSDDDQTVALAHLIRPKQQASGAQQSKPAAGSKVRNEFVSTFSCEGADPEGKRDLKAKSLATDGHAGRLRLIRTGSELTFLAAEENAAFQELQRVNVSTDALMGLRLSANTSGAPCKLSLRLHDIRIRAGELPGAASPKKKSKVQLVVWLLAIVVVGGGGFLLWRYQPWRR